MSILFNNAQAISIGETVGSVMASLVDAQEQAARATVDFVNHVGYETVEDPETGSETGDLRTVKYKFRKQNEEGIVSDYEAEVPLLTLVDVPAISINKAKLEFSYEISETSSSEHSSENGYDRQYGHNF